MVLVTRPDASKILKEYLKSHGITQTWVAKKLGMSVAGFNNYLNGQNKFNADFALSVSKVLNISPSIFLKESYRNSVEWRGTTWKS